MKYIKIYNHCIVEVNQTDKNKAEKIADRIAEETKKAIQSVFEDTNQTRNNNLK